MNPSSKQKISIRKRDQKYIPLTGRCSCCGSHDEPTSRHHLWYPNHFDHSAVIEVCDTCDNKIHNREDAEGLARSINAIHNLTITNDEVYIGAVRVGTAEVDAHGTTHIGFTGGR